MRDYSHLLAAFYATPWAILPSKLEQMRAFVQMKVGGGNVPDDQVEELLAGRRPMQVQMAGRVAVLPVFGVISQRVGMMERASGGVSTEEIGATLESLVADKSVKSVVLAFDSPGGNVKGVRELAEKIRGLRQEKKIVGIADSTAASAAYWLIAQTSEVNVVPSGMIGSIGVIAAHDDLSKYLELQGVKTTYVTSSPFKAEGAPEFPLSEEARAEMQAKVDHYHAMFVADIAKGRGLSEAKVNSDFGQGRLLTPKDAVSRGMADKIATLEQVLSRLGAGADSGAGLSAKLASVRARAAEVGLSAGE